MSSLSNVDCNNAFLIFHLHLITTSPSGMSLKILWNFSLRDLFIFGVDDSCQSNKTIIMTAVNQREHSYWQSIKQNNHNDSCQSKRTIIMTAVNQSTIIWRGDSCQSNITIMWRDDSCQSNRTIIMWHDGICQSNRTIILWRDDSCQSNRTIKM